MRLLIVVPAYNEERTIGSVLKDIECVDLSAFRVTKEVIVVDDGSTDTTASVVERAGRGVRLIRCARRGGKGSAVRMAIEHSDADFVIIQDADLEYDPHEYRKLLEPVVREGAQVVFGSRFLSRRYPEKMLFWNYIGNLLGTAATNLLYRAGLTDLMTCYKLMPVSLLKELRVQSCGFEICPELTAKILKKGIRIREVPIGYRGRTKKEGKKIVFGDSLRILIALVRHRFSK